MENTKFLSIDSLTVNIDSLKIDDEQFFQLYQDNRDLKFESDRRENLIIMPPTGGETGRCHARIIQQLLNLNDRVNGI
ncbi:Uma2 family endonuclease [Oxynema sp. CENA135]|uniref:Uma2 family endonuclease n=1 Tax=Oxynema sp. CENA135 TaxID=984206 RepID=UPI00351C1D9D